MFGLNEKEMKILKALNTPKKIQDFLNKIPINFEEDEKDTCISPRMVLREWKAHCIEGALLAAVALRIHGEKPLVVDLTSVKKDFDHVICVFKRGRYWGAKSKHFPILTRSQISGLRLADKPEIEAGKIVEWKPKKLKKVRKKN